MTWTVKIGLPPFSSWWGTATPGSSSHGGGEVGQGEKIKERKGGVWLAPTSRLWVQPTASAGERELITDKGSCFPVALFTQAWVLAAGPCGWGQRSYVGRGQHGVPGLRFTLSWPRPGWLIDLPLTSHCPLSHPQTS